MIASCLDPVRFVRDALEYLPPDPRTATADDVKTVMAIVAGLELHVDDVYDGLSSIDPDDPDLRSEVAWLVARRNRCTQARDEVARYLSAALAGALPTTGGEA